MESISNKLKHCLKNKVKINKSSVIMFLMLGFITNMAIAGTGVGGLDVRDRWDRHNDSELDFGVQRQAALQYLETKKHLNPNQKALFRDKINKENKITRFLLFNHEMDMLDDSMRDLKANIEKMREFRQVGTDHTHGQIDAIIELPRINDILDWYISSFDILYSTTATLMPVDIQIEGVVNRLPSNYRDLRGDYKEKVVAAINKLSNLSVDRKKHYTDLVEGVDLGTVFDFNKVFEEIYKIRKEAIDENANSNTSGPRNAVGGVEDIENYRTEKEVEIRNMNIQNREEKNKIWTYLYGAKTKDEIDKIFEFANKVHEYEKMISFLDTLDELKKNDTDFNALKKEAESILETTEACNIEKDSDSDGQADHVDNDMDNDGVENDADPHPYNKDVLSGYSDLYGLGGSRPRMKLVPIPDYLTGPSTPDTDITTCTLNPNLVGSITNKVTAMNELLKLKNSIKEDGDITSKGALISEIERVYDNYRNNRSTDVNYTENIEEINNAIDLQKAKIRAKKEIDSMDHLTSDKIEGFKKEIDHVSTISQIEPIVERARQDGEPNDVADTNPRYKEELLQFLNEKQYINSNQKQAFIEMIENDDNENNFETIKAKITRIDKYMMKKINIINTSKQNLEDKLRRDSYIDFENNTSGYRELSNNIISDLEDYYTNTVNIITAKGLEDDATEKFTVKLFEYGREVVKLREKYREHVINFIDTLSKLSPDRVEFYKNEIKGKDVSFGGTYIVDDKNPDFIDELHRLKKQAIEENSAINPLDELKATVKEYINGLPNLEQTQKDKLNAEVDDAQDEQTVNAVKTKATEVNDTMGHIKTVFTELEELRNTVTVEENQGVLDTAIAKKPNVYSDTDNENLSRTLAELGATKLSVELREAKEKAKTYIGTLTNLNSDRQNHYTGRIEQVSDINEIEPIKEEARVENELTKAKNDAKTYIDTLTNLGGDRVTHYKDEIDRVTQASEIEPIKERARVENELIGAKNDAKQYIDTLTNLSGDRVTHYKDEIDRVTSINGIEPIKELAKNENDLSKAKADAKAYIDTLDNLDGTRKDYYKGEIEKVTQDSEIDPIKEQADSENDLNKAKKDGKEYIDTLTSLSGDRITYYKDEIDKVNQADEIQPIKEQANNENELNKRTNDFNALKDEIKEYIRGLEHLEQGQKDLLIAELDTKQTTDELNQVRESATNLNNSMGELKGVVRELETLRDSETTLDKYKQHINDKLNEKDAAYATTDKAIVDDTTRKLREFKTTIEDEINAENVDLEKLKTDTIAHLKEFADTVSPDIYEERIRASRDKTEVLEIKNEVLKQHEANRLERLKEKAKSDIERLDRLTPEKQNQYKNEVTLAKDEQTIEDIVDRATNEHNAIIDLENEIDEAKRTIDSLEHLDTPTKENYKNQLIGKSSSDEINGVVNNAKLENEKAKAIKTIDGLDNLDTSRKDEYKGEVNAVQDISAIQPIVDRAVEENERNRNLQDELARLKDEAKKYIDTLTNLGEDRVNHYKDTIDRVTQASEIDHIKEQANSENNLNKAKADAKAYIDTLTNLNGDRVTHYKDEIDKVTNINEIEPIKELARAENDRQANDNIDSLRNDLREYIKSKTEINNLQKEKLLNQVDTKNSEQEIEEFKGLIDNLDINMKTYNFIMKVLDYRTELHNTGYRKDYHDTVPEYKTEIDTVLDKYSKLDKIDVNELKTAYVGILGEHSDRFNEINRRYVELSKEFIDGLSNLTPDKKLEYKNRIDEKYNNRIDQAFGIMLSTTEDIFNIKNEARLENEEKANLDDAKNEAKKYIDTLTNLDSDRKDYYKGEIDKVTSVDEIEPIKELARVENDLNKAKEDAKQYIDTLTNLGEDRINHYKDEIDKVTNVNEIEPIKEQAKNENDSSASDLDKAKNDAKAYIDTLTNLGEDRVNHYKDEIDKVTSVDEIEPIKELAKNENDSSASNLDKAKDEAKKYIDGLDNLSEDEKNHYKEQIDNISEAAGNKELEIIKDKAKKENSDKVEHKVSREVLELERDLTSILDDDISIRDNIGKDIFGNLRFKSTDIRGVKEIITNIGAAEIGGSYKIKDGIAKDLRVGGFIGYNGFKHHQVNTGLTLNYKDYKGFVRYRYDRLKDFNIHTLDVYNRYGYKDNYGNVILEGYGELLLTNQFKSKKDNITIENNFRVGGNVGFNVGYDFKELLNQDLQLTLRQRLDFKYNNESNITEHFQDGTSLTKHKSYDVFHYNIGLKLDYKYKNYGLSASTSLNEKLRTTSNLSLSYSW